MNYFIKIEFKYPEQRLMKGIYRIDFENGKFYIGRAKRFAERIYMHEIGINKSLMDVDSTNPVFSHYRNIARYLHEHPQLTYLKAQMIHKCVTFEDLYQWENQILSDLWSHPDCLNTSNAGGRSGKNDDTWDIKFINHIPHYFDPSNPEILPLHAYTPIRKTGKPVRPPRTKESYLKKPIFATNGQADSHKA